MNLTKLVVFSRKIHRLCVNLMIVIGMGMMSTGLTMKYSFIRIMDPGTAVKIHSTLSTFFVLILAVMMFTGAVLYYNPKIQKWMARKSEQVL